MPSYGDMDKVFWQDYVRFGSNARYQSAVALRQAYKLAEDDTTRRFYGLAIFEQVMLATEDLYLVYAAFRHRDSKPPLETLLTLASTHKKWQQIDKELGEPYNKASDKKVRELLHLPEPDDTAEIQRRYSGCDAHVIAHYLEALPANLHNARENRALQDGINVKLLNKVKHGFVAMSDTSAFGSPYTHQNDPNPPLTVTVLVDDRKNADVGTWGVWVGPAQVEAFVSALRDYAHTIQVIVSLCLGFDLGTLDARDTATPSPTSP